MLVKWLKIGLFLFMGAVIAALLSWRYFTLEVSRFLQQPLTLPKAELITVKPGQSVYTLVRHWQQQGWLHRTNRTRWLLWQQPRWGKIKAGTYQLQADKTLAQTLEPLIRGAEHQFSITFIEGSRWREWQQQLAVAPQLQASALLEDNAALLSALQLEAANLEGWLYPDTYFYTAGTPALILVKRAHERMKQLLASAWQARFRLVDKHLTSPYQALILASIIEKETGKGSERATISSVFHNRFEKRMRLQTDPTVIYGMGESFNGNITKADLRRKTPYNTYVIKGLPPTPIAMPGLDAINAALQPEQTPFYYFVSRGDGSHVFSSSLSEHNTNVRRYILKQE